MNDQERPVRGSNRIPEFATLEEEAHFWDTHSFSDYLDELEPAERCFAKNLSGPAKERLKREAEADATAR